MRVTARRGRTLLAVPISVPNAHHPFSRVLTEVPRGRDACVPDHRCGARSSRGVQTGGGLAGGGAASGTDRSGSGARAPLPPCLRVLTSQDVPPHPPFPLIHALRTFLTLSVSRNWGTEFCVLREFE